MGVVKSAIIVRVWLWCVLMQKIVADNLIGSREHGQAEVSRYRYHQNVCRMVSSVGTGALVSIL